MGTRDGLGLMAIAWVKMISRHYCSRLGDDIRRSVHVVLGQSPWPVTPTMTTASRSIAAQNAKKRGRVGKCHR
jgi:hypothetical protein